MSADDDRAVKERLAALEAEVKADSDAQRSRKEAALAKLKAQRAEQEKESARARATAQPAAKPPQKKQSRHSAEIEIDDGDGIGAALSLAKRAHGVKQELATKGEKSWIKSGLASMLLGPLGWLYAGSLREAVPASAAWILFAAIASKLPMLLLMPVLMVALPLSGIAGAIYAVQYNRTGSRQRLWKPEKSEKSGKQLPGRRKDDE